MTQKNKLIAFLACGVLLLVLPLVLQQFGNAWVRIADVALLYTMLALGLNIVVGYAGLLDLGYVAFFAVGAYLYGLLASPHLTDTMMLNGERCPFTENQDRAMADGDELYLLAPLAGG